MQPNATGQNLKSGKGNGKASPGKGTAQWWEQRLFRPRYTAQGGTRVEVAQLYVRIQHGGRREAVGLGTNDRGEAGRKAAAFYRTLRGRGWEAAFAELDPERAKVRDEEERRKSSPTIGEWISAARAVFDGRPPTFSAYEASFRRVAADAMGIRDPESRRFDFRHGGRDAWLAKVNAILVSDITPAKVEAWRTAYLRAAEGNPLALQRARRSSNSYLLNCKALFSKNTLKRIGLAPPSPLPFADVQLSREGSTRYVATVDARELMIAARTELRGSDPEAWKAFMLLLCAGLRRGEVDALLWSHVDAVGKSVRVAVSDVASVKSATSERVVPLADSIITDLESFRSKATGDFVIESVHPVPPPMARRRIYRCRPLWRRLTRWLRAHGVKSNKPLHELRKEYGSQVTAVADIYTASRQLGHNSVRVTERYYSEQRRRVVVDPLASSTVVQTGAVARAAHE